MYFSGFALANHVLSTVNVKSPSHCVIHCLGHPSCQSINFKIIGNPEHVCELNDKTEDEVALTSNSDFKYYGLHDRLHGSSQCNRPLLSANCLFLLMVLLSIICS